MHFSYLAVVKDIQSNGASTEYSYFVQEGFLWKERRESVSWEIHMEERGKGNKGSGKDVYVQDPASRRGDSLQRQGQGIRLWTTNGGLHPSAGFSSMSLPLFHLEVLVKSMGFTMPKMTTTVIPRSRRLARTFLPKS